MRKNREAGFFETPAVRPGRTDALTFLLSLFRSAFLYCESLEGITIPLKDDLIAADNAFISCDDLHQVDLVEGELHKTIAALNLEEWRTNMYDEINSINQILPNASASAWVYTRVAALYRPELLWPSGEAPCEKAQAIRRWIRSVLDKIIRYQVEHRRLLDDVATILQRELPFALSQDIVNNVFRFLELPSYTFGVGDDGEDDNDEGED